jgi:hypothetical protein
LHEDILRGALLHFTTFAARGADAIRQVMVPGPDQEQFSLPGICCPCIAQTVEKIHRGMPAVTLSALP